MSTEMPQRLQVGATAPARDVVVDGVRLAVDDTGDGPAIVCLHAIGHGASDFARLHHRLTPGWRVVAPDWPGQGRSAPDREPPRSSRRSPPATPRISRPRIGSSACSSASSSRCGTSTRRRRPPGWDDPGPADQVV
jgi:pimeloyl-ACP methyl ester carboxylesterase